MRQSRFEWLSAAVLALALQLAACEPRAAPAATPPVDPSLDRGSARSRPEFVDCGREDGPARPLSEAEYVNWYFGAWRGDSYALQESNAKGQEALLARSPPELSVELAELLARVGVIHLEVHEWHAADGCALEIEGSAVDDEVLAMHWTAAEQHLGWAFERAQQASHLGSVLDGEQAGRSRCVYTVAAAKLGNLATALSVSEQLEDTQTCTAWALLVLADALDTRGRYVEANRLYRRVMTIHPFDSGPSAATCQVAPTGPRTSPVPELRGPPRPFSQDCSWDRYVRYRLAWSSLQRGLIDEARAAELLQAIAIELHPEWDFGARLLATAIEMDVERWQARGAQTSSQEVSPPAGVSSSLSKSSMVRRLPTCESRPSADSATARFSAPSSTIFCSTLSSTTSR